MLLLLCCDTTFYFLSCRHRFKKWKRWSFFFFFKLIIQSVFTIQKSHTNDGSVTLSKKTVKATKALGKTSSNIQNTSWFTTSGTFYESKNLDRKSRNEKISNIHSSCSGKWHFKKISRKRWINYLIIEPCLDISSNVNPSTRRREFGLNIGAF